MYEEYFRAADAQTEAAKSGLAAVNALHVSAAHLPGADVFVTTERPSKLDFGH